MTGSTNICGQLLVSWPKKRSSQTNELLSSIFTIQSTCPDDWYDVCLCTAL